MWSLSTARNGHRVRLYNFANKLKITICALSIACSNKKKKQKTTKMVLEENDRKNNIKKDFSVLLAIFI